MNTLCTEKCILCGKPAVLYQGHVIAKERMVLGNLVSRKIIAGFCEDCKYKGESDVSGCYGTYSLNRMGKPVPFRL